MGLMLVNGCVGVLAKKLPSSAEATEKFGRERNVLPIRPRDYYKLKYAYPGDSELCGAFASTMSESYSPEKEDASRYDLSGSVLSEPGMLLMGSINIFEPWDSKSLSSDICNNDNTVAKKTLLGVIDIDINHDGLPDRLYRLGATQSLSPPFYGVTHTPLWYRLGSENEFPLEQEKLLFLLRDEGTASYKRLKLKKLARGYRPYGKRIHCSHHNFSVFTYSGNSYIIAASVKYPTIESTKLFLVNFDKSEPYVACYLEGDDITNSILPSESLKYF
ncbi:MAG: hypothetical protein AAFW83_11895 [Pseudomonadota bacterium]